MDVAREPRLLDICARSLLFLSTFRRHAASRPMDPSWVRSKLLQTLAEQERVAATMPRMAKLYAHIKYPLVVTADAVILGAPWDGASYWDLLETELFGTAAGGTRFFELLEHQESSSAEIQEVFFYCLGLGFAGKYLGRGTELLSEVRRNCLAAAQIAAPDAAYKFSPQAYQENVEDDLTVRLPVVNAVRIGIVMFGVLLLIGLGAYAFYRNSVAQVATHASQLATGPEGIR